MPTQQISMQQSILWTIEAAVSTYVRRALPRGADIHEEGLEQLQDQAKWRPIQQDSLKARETREALFAPPAASAERDRPPESAATDLRATLRTLTTTA